MPDTQLYHRIRASVEKTMAGTAATNVARIVHEKLASLHLASAKRVPPAAPVAPVEPAIVEPI